MDNESMNSEMELYPVTKFINVKLPKFFPDVLSKSYLQLVENNTFQDARRSKDSSCDLFSTLKADYPIPCCCGIYYFEIRLLLNETLGFIGLGFGNSNIDEGQQLGKVLNSIGLYVTNGRTVSLFLCEKEYPIAINVKTRVQHLGIGINFIEHYAFCTVNGILLMHMKELPHRDKFRTDCLYPAVSSQSPNCSFVVNLGFELTNQPFSYNFLCFKKNELKKKRETCLSQEYSPNLAFVSVYNLVSDYLLHHGFAESWEALNKYDNSQAKDQSLETIKNRRTIQKCILNQDFLAAITSIKGYFPDFFNQYPIYEFILKCRHFINLIIRKPILNGAADDQDDFGTSPKSARLDPLLMKRKNHVHACEFKFQAVVAMDMSDDYVTDNKNGVKCEEIVDSEMCAFNNSHDNEQMDTDSMESEVGVKNNVSNSSASDHMVGDHVMYVIQYGKKLKEEAQTLFTGMNGSTEYKQGVELLTSAFSLIAYRDPYSSPFKDILDSKQMEDLAHKINGAINGMLGKTTRARLDSLLDQCVTETQHNSRNNPILASIHPKLLMSELLTQNK